MASQAIYDAIRAHLEANWTATPLVFENEDYSALGSHSHFAIVEIAGSYFGRESIGTGDPDQDRFDEEGELWVHLMMRANVGTRVARGHLTNLADIFRGLKLMSDRLEFLDARVGFGESVSQSSGNDGGWFRLSMTIDWRLIDA